MDCRESARGMILGVGHTERGRNLESHLINYLISFFFLNYIVGRRWENEFKLDLEYEEDGFWAFMNAKLRSI